MRLLIRNGQVYDSHCRAFRAGAVLIEDDRIVNVMWSDQDVTCDEVMDAHGRYIVPGLVDVHTHGRNGFDFATASLDELGYMAKRYAESGVTTVIPTLASAEPHEWLEAIGRLNQCRSNQKGARFEGVHLEGRYLNPVKRGVHAPSLLAAPNAAELKVFLEAIDGVRHVTFAPELDKDGSFLEAALSMGATVGIGHTAATYDEANEALLRGATVMTHLFNAMPTLHHREGGAVCAGLVSERTYCELICDGLHVSPEMVRMAWKLKGDKLLLVTDSMEATGCPDGSYAIAGVSVVVTDGRAQTEDGVLAGSTLSLWQGVMNLCKFANVSLGEAVYAATYVPAVAYGMEQEIGSVEAGKRADLLIATDQSVERVMCGGEWI